MKIKFLIFLISSFMITAVLKLTAAAESSIQNINPEYKDEVIERCLTFEEYENNKNLYNAPDCLTNFDETFTADKVNFAIDFAKKIKYVYRTHDIAVLADILPYPVYINNYYNQNIVINSKREFLKLNKNIILNKSIFTAIDQNKLFWNWQGFMLGNGNIWFWIDDNISRVTFNL